MNRPALPSELDSTRPRLFAGRAARAAAVGLCVVGALVGAGQRAANAATPATTIGLDPFRHANAAAPAPNLSRLLNLAQAEPAPVETPAQPKVKAKAKAPAKGTTTAGPAAAPAAPVSCTDDAQCPDETICEAGMCRRIERRINVFYLYYQEGSFREILGLYWSKRGNTGYTVVAPFYWNYFSPTSRSRVVAPFYWHFEDDTAKSQMTVIVPGLPIMWSSAPGARGFAIWPLFYASSKFGWAAPLLGSFKVNDPDQKRSFGAVAFLYWWGRKPDSSFDLGFPLFVSSRSSASAFTFALPLNFYWRTGDDAKTLAIPLLYRHSWKNGAGTYTPLGYVRHEGKSTSGALAWLYWFGRNSATDKEYDVVAPLFWSFRSREHAATMLVPIVWDFKAPDSRVTVVAPIVVHLRQGPSFFNAAFPLWWSAGNEKTDWRFDLFVPALFVKRSEHGKRLTWVSLIGGYHRDADAGTRTLALLPGLFFRRDPTTEIDVVTPFFIRHHNIEGDTTTKLIAALLYLRDDPGGSTTVLFPFFWRFWDRTTSASATSVFPFFFHRAGPRDTVTYAGVFPLWFYRRQMTDGWGGGLFPLAFFGRAGESSHGVVFPVFWRFANTAKGTSTTVTPLFVNHTTKEGSDTALLPLLVFFGHDRATSYQVQFPLFWRFANSAAGSSTTVTPLGFFGSSPEGWRAGVGPLLPLIWAAGGGPKRHFVLFPLFWHFGDDRRDESTTVVGTFMHRRRGGETTDALFPLIYFRRGARQPGGFDETSFTLFPLVHYHRNADTRVLVTPLGASASGPQRAAGFVGPYLWYRGANISAQGIPFLYADVFQKNTQERTRQWGPFFAFDGPDHSARLLFPLFGTYHDSKEDGTYVFPSFFHQRKADGYAVDTLLPLFWHSRWRDRTTTVVGPWYSRQGNDVHNTGLAPLYFWAKNPDRTLLVIPPLLTFHRHDFKADKSVTWAGPFLHTHSRDGESTTVFPLWWSGRTGGRSYRVLGPLYWHFADSAKSTAWSLLGPLYWSQNGSGRTRALLPVAWYTRDEAKQSGSEAILPLFYASHGPGRLTVLTLLAGISRTPESRRWYAGPLYVSDTVESSSRFFIPLFFTHTNKTTETTTRVIPPLLHFSRSSPEKSISTWLALFWRRTDIASATTLVLPLFLDVHDYRASRTTLLLPLFVRHANETTGDSYLLAPLLYRHTAPGMATTVAFPLWWDFKGPDRRTTILFPLFAHWTRPTHTGTYVFPIFYYRKGLMTGGATPGAPDGTWRLFIPPLFDAAVKRKGDLRWEILGGLFGKERIGRNHYLKVLFMTFETQRASQVQTSWYGQPRRPGRTHPVRGLATSAW